MAKLRVIEQKPLALELSDLEAGQLRADLAASDGKEFDLVRIRQGVYAISERRAQQQPNVQTPVHAQYEKPLNPVDKKIFDFIRAKNLGERVEGKFETLLNPEELARFRVLLKEGQIECFKLNESYKKGVYQFPDRKKDAQNGNSSNIPRKNNLNQSSVKIQGPVQNNMQQKTTNFERKPAVSDSDVSKILPAGFVAMKNDDLAREFGITNAEAIKGGKISGIKSFDGTIYFIDRKKLDECQEKIINFMKSKKNSPLQDVVDSTAIDKNLIKAVCEFLKDSGELIEKRKDNYSYID
jgi:hypothetical protein